MAIFTQIGGISTGSITNVLKGPLSKLFGKDMGVQSYHYPENLTSDPARMHYVKFDIYNIQPVKFETTELTSTIEGAFKDISTGKLTKTLQAPTKRSIASISLYMPDTLNMTYNNHYADAALPFSFKIAEKAGEFAQNLSINDGDIGKAIMATASSDATSLQVATQIPWFGAGADTTGLLLKAAGYASNPQVQMLYHGNSFREFQFEFILTAKSKEESDQISAICNAFVYASSPSVNRSSGMFFIPPSIFKIQLLMAEKTNLSGLSAMLQKAGNSLVPGLNLGTKIGSAMGGSKAAENNRLFKVGDCVLQNVNVDYAPNGWSAHSDGAPLQTRLTLNFSEIHIVHRDRFLNSQNNENGKAEIR